MNISGNQSSERQAGAEKPAHFVCGYGAWRQSSTGLFPMPTDIGLEFSTS